MPAIVLVGAQWGDEGKGKATDLLGSSVDYVVRYQGGANAGHTVVVGDQVYKLHTIPTGVLTPGIMNVVTKTGTRGGTSPVPVPVPVPGVRRTGWRSR